MVNHLDGYLKDLLMPWWNLHKRRFPPDTIFAKMQAYIKADLITELEAREMFNAIRAERHEPVIKNALAGLTDFENVAEVQVGGTLGGNMDLAEMAELLARRESQMREGGSDANPTDQWCVYTYIVERLSANQRPIRIMIQASAGTGDMLVHYMTIMRS